MNETANDLSKLHDAIHRYFGAALSDGEEIELKRIIATTSLSSPLIDEAKAVMGFFAAERADIRAGKNKIPLRVAASIAICLICGTAIVIGSGVKTANRCVAYVGENKITDDRIVLSMMHNELNAINSASIDMESDINNQFSSLANELSF